MNKQTITRAKKARNTANSHQIRDIFTTICRTDLQVECVKEYKFHPTRRWRFDYAIPEHKIALEVEGGVWTGGRHTSPKGFLNDIEKYNTATLDYKPHKKRDFGAKYPRKHLFFALKVIIL